MENLTVAQNRQQHIRNRQNEIADMLEAASALRSELAMPAAMGDASAIAELADLDTQEAKLQTEARTLDVATTGADRLVAEAREREKTVVNTATAASKRKAEDKLLLIDDQIDAALQSARDLFADRDAHMRKHNLRSGYQNAIIYSIKHYFDRFLAHEGGDYRSIQTIAEIDGHAIGRQSPATAVRPPRAMSLMQRLLTETINDKKAHMRA